MWGCGWGPEGDGHWGTGGRTGSLVDVALSSSPVGGVGLRPGRPKSPDGKTVVSALSLRTDIIDKCWFYGVDPPWGCQPPSKGVGR